MALNLKGENENLCSSTNVLPKTSNLVLSRCFFADNGKEMDKNTHVGCAKLLFLPGLNMQICDVLVSIAVVVSKAPY